MTTEKSQKKKLHFFQRRYENRLKINTCFFFKVSVLNGSISTALVNLANAPQLKEVPEKIVKLSQELGQFGSRLTGVESQVTGTKNDLSKVQDSLKKLPKKTLNNPDVATSNGQVDKVNKL